MFRVLAQIFLTWVFISTLELSARAQELESAGQQQSNSIENSSQENTEKTFNNQRKKIVKGKKHENFSPAIEWGEPEIATARDKKVHNVTLHGTTEEGIKILIGRQILWISTSEKTGQKSVEKIPVKKLLIKGKKLIQNQGGGEFSINLKLPEGEVQIPVGLKKGKQRAKYQLVLEVKPKKIELKNQPKINTDCHYCFWLGLGVSYLGYQQDPPQNVKPIDYGAFGFPAMTFRTRLQIAKNWKLRFGYFLLNGPELSSSLNITNKSIKWQHMSLETDYRFVNSFRLFGVKFEPGLLLGVQNQDMPFLIQTSSNVFTIDSLKFNTISVGGMFFVNTHKKLFYEIFVRAQLPFSSSGNVELTSGFVFDGSVAAIYRLGDNWRIGGFWGGQYHNYNYDIGDEKGTYSLLSSKLDIALGYDF